MDILVDISNLSKSDAGINNYQVRANAVAGAVEEVKTFLPQVLAGQDIDSKSTGALGKDCSVDADQALQNQSERPLLELGGLAKMESTGGVRSSIEVLAAGVTEVDSGGIDD